MSTLPDQVVPSYGCLRQFYGLKRLIRGKGLLQQSYNPDHYPL